MNKVGQYYKTEDSAWIQKQLNRTYRDTELANIVYAPSPSTCTPMQFPVIEDSILGEYIHNHEILPPNENQIDDKLEGIGEGNDASDVENLCFSVDQKIPQNIHEETLRSGYKEWNVAAKLELKTLDAV